MKFGQIHDFLNFDAGRPSLIDAMTLKLGNKLNKFLIPLIRDEVYNNRALELLTHTRRVSILSINIIPDKSSTKKIVDLSEKYFDYLYKYVFEFDYRDYE